MSKISVSDIEGKIHLLRGERVMLDADLALLYGVETKVLKQAVKRNVARFPSDFMLQLNRSEYTSLRSQIVTLEKGGRGRYSKYLPCVFTEQGVAMLSSVLSSKKAIGVNIEIIRTFVKLRKFLMDNKELAKKLKELEERSSKHDKTIQSIIEAIQQLIATPEKTKKKIGFHASLSLK